MNEPHRRNEVQPDTGPGRRREPRTLDELLAEVRDETEGNGRATETRSSDPSGDPRPPKTPSRMPGRSRKEAAGETPRRRKSSGKKTPGSTRNLGAKPRPRKKTRPRRKRRPYVDPPSGAMFDAEEVTTGLLVLALVFVSACWVTQQASAFALVLGLPEPHRTLGCLLAGAWAGAWVWNRRRAKRVAKARHLRGELPT